MDGSKGSGEAESWFIGIDDGLETFFFAGFIWKATVLAPPDGRENFLGGGTFRRTFRPMDMLRIQSIHTVACFPSVTPLSSDLIHVSSSVLSGILPEFSAIDCSPLIFLCPIKSENSVISARG